MLEDEKSSPREYKTDSCQTTGCSTYSPRMPENLQGEGGDTQNVGDLTCLIKVIETMSQETMPWSMSSKKAVRVNASISL